MGKYIFLLLIIVFGLLLVSTDVFAENENAASKLGRGLANSATCWIEVPKQIYLVSNEREPITGLIYGTAKGVAETIRRAATGVYDTASFLIPPYDKTLMEPEFVFEGWNYQQE